MASGTHINLYRRRRLGQLIGDSLRFSSSNFVALLKYMLIFVLPLFVVYWIFSVIFLFGFQRSFLGIIPGANSLLQDSVRVMSLGAGTISMLLLLLTGLTAYLALNSFVLRYGEQQGRVRTREIWQDWKAHALHFAGIGAVRVGLYVPFVLVWQAWTGEQLLVKIAVSFTFTYLWVSTSLADVIRMNETCSTWKAIRRSFSLVNQSWWETFFLHFILAIFNLLFIILALIIFGAMISGIQDLFGANTSTGVVIGMGILGLMLLAFTPFFTAFWTASCLQYFNISQAPSRASFTLDLIDQIGKSEDIDASHEINEQF